ncbi:MAG: hypothetical protein EOO16_12205 [Chitinophagaceae bacterium]|nr:MAG: hypothetical protein EOO16_12205 [Chitinophagaceae bacterium]
MRERKDSRSGAVSGMHSGGGIYCCASKYKKMFFDKLILCLAWQLVNLEYHPDCTGEEDEVIF